MIIDSHAHISDEEDTSGFRTAHISAEELLQYMQGPLPIRDSNRDIDMALVQPMISPTRSGQPSDHHQYVADAVTRFQDRLIGCFVANPLLDTEATLAALTDLVDRNLFRCVKLHPTSHGYHPMKLRERLDPILSCAAQLDIPVIVHQGDPPFGHPSQLAFLAEAHPQVRFIIAHMARQRIVMSDEAVYVASKNSNVYIETGWGDLPRLKEGIGILSSERFVFGSDCPVLEIGSQLRVVDVLGWAPPIGLGLSDDEIESIMGNNMASMLGVQ